MNMIRTFFPQLFIVALISTFFPISHAFSDKPAEGAFRVTGRISALSSLPDPNTTPYEDCLLVHQLLKIQAPEKTPFPDKALIIFIGFKDRKLEPASALKVGDMLALELIPEANMDDETASLQRADSFNASENYYFALNFKMIGSSIDLHQNSSSSPKPANTFETGRRFNVTGYQPTLDDLRLLLPAKTRAQQIANDLEWISRLNESHGGWEDWFSSLEKMRQELIRQVGKWDILITPDQLNYFEGINWLYFRIDGDRYPKKVVNALINTNRYLNDRGIEFIVVPVPPKEFYTAQYFCGNLFPHDGVVQPFRLKFMHYLLSQGIEVTDLLPSMLVHAGQYQSYYYPNSDQHPADGLIQLAAETISSRLERLKLKPTVDPQSFISTENRTVVPEKFHNRAYKMRYSADYKIEGVQLLDRDQKIITPADTSSILMVGDSFLTSTQKRGLNGADVWAHIALHTGVVPQIISRAGTSGAPKIYPIVKKLKTLKSNKVCILFFDEKYLYFFDDEWVDR
jgi:hypothetical protein